MKNKKMLFPPLLSVALVLSLILPVSVLNVASVMAQAQVTPMLATGEYHTVGLKSAGTVVTTGEYFAEVSGWTGITQVGAGTWHTVGRKADGTVVAAGKYHTVGLKSDGTVVAAGYNDDGQCDVGGWNLVLAVPSSEEVQVGIEAGDWIKIEYTTSGWSDGCPYPEWLRLEFLEVEGTIATVRATLHISDGTEQSDTVPVDVVAGGEALGFSRFVIPANLTTGDSIYMTELIDLAIEGETTRTYAGARRTIVYTSVSQNEAQFAYYWDKLTGVIVEASTSYSNITITAKITETNMWEAATIQMPWWPWAIVAAAVVALAIVLYRSKKRKTPTTPTPPTEGS